MRTSYVRDDRPLAGPDSPPGPFFYSRNRHLVGYAGIALRRCLCRLYDANHKPGPIRDRQFESAFLQR